MIIGISAVDSGKQSGKDTFAKLASARLTELGIPNHICHFAAPMKKACSILFGVPECEETKEDYSGWDWPESNTLGMTGPMTNRQVWQYFATNIMRDNWQYDIWIKITEKYIERMRSENPDTVFFVPDVRFPNEVSHLDMLVDIYRTSAYEKNFLGKDNIHVSELAGKEIPQDAFTLKLVNDGTIEAMDKSIIKFVDETLIAQHNKRRNSTLK